MKVGGQIRNQQTGKNKTLNCAKLCVVDPNIIWDKIRPRPIRQSHKSSVPVVLPRVVEQEPENEPEAIDKGASNEPSEMPLPQAAEDNNPPVAVSVPTQAAVVPDAPMETEQLDAADTEPQIPLRRSKRVRPLVDYFEGKQSIKRRCTSRRATSQPMEVACVSCY